jgi:hypothetical protein
VHRPRTTTLSALGDTNVVPIGVDDSEVAKSPGLVRERLDLAATVADLRLCPLEEPANVVHLENDLDSKPRKG